MIFIRTWNVLGWSCSRKSLIRIHIWRNYVIKGVGKLFKGVVAKNIYHYRRCWFLTYLNLNWWPWLSSGDDEWPTAMGHSWELYIQNTHSLQVKLLFQWSYFLSAKTVFGKMQLKSRTYFIATSKRWILCAFTFLFLSAVAHINVALVSCEKSLKTVTDERDFHHTSVSTVVRFIISSSIAPHKIFFIQTGLKSFSPVDSQDIFHLDRFYILPPKWIHKIFFIQRGLKSSFPMDSQDLVQCASNARQLH